MSKTLDKLLTLAESQTGYTEKNNDKDLDAAVGPTAGNGNHTKYARDLTAMGLPGYCGAAWCAVYQMWLEVKTMGKEQALKTLGPQFYNCFAVRDHAKATGRWLAAGATPKPGYRVIFRQSHIALVTRVAGGRIYTNEGNTSNGTAVVRNGGMVCNKSYLLKDSSILGYVKVEYPEEPVEQTKRSGWSQEDGGWRYYLGDTGLCVRNAWYKDGQDWYWFDGAGIMVCNTWYRYKDAWYYLGDDGAMCTGQVTVDGKWYVMDNAGRMIVDPVVLTPDQDGALRWPGLVE